MASNLLKGALVFENFVPVFFVAAHKKGATLKSRRVLGPHKRPSFFFCCTPLIAGPFELPQSLLCSAGIFEPANQS